MTNMRGRIRIAVAVSILISSFLVGFVYRDLQAGAGVQVLSELKSMPADIAATTKAKITQSSTELQPVETYSSVITYVDANYYGTKPKPKQLTYAAIRGMLATLGDRYTRFLDPAEHKEMSEENSGNFEGIGAELDTKDGRVFIKKTLDNSPALRANLKSKDVILKVNDKMIQGMEILDVVKLIRGPRNTKVRLTIKREDTPEPFEVELTRDIIPFALVESRMEDTVNKIGYVTLRQFTEKSDADVSSAIKDLDMQGAKALIFDLRGNPGGLLDAAVSVGSRFVQDGDIVIIQNRGGQRSAIPIETDKRDPTRRPMVVLIDHNTASAAEIVSGAIQDHKTGTLIGTESFGKGLVQTIINLDDGSAVAITTAKYLTPNGHEVTPTQKIKPDIVIDPTDDDIKSENDVQLKRAVQYLKERLGVAQVKSDGQKS